MKNLMELWETTKNRESGKIAAIYKDRNYSYLELDKKIKNLAGYLQKELNLSQGANVALLLPNCIEFVIVYFAILYAGATVVFVNPRLQSPEIEFILNDSESSCLITDALIFAKISAIRKDLKSLKSVILTDAKQAHALYFEELISREQAITPLVKKEDDTAAIIYTSGTTGKPKGAMLTHGNIIFNCFSAINGFGYLEDDIHLIALPFVHVTASNTQLIASIYKGSTAVITAETNPLILAKLIEKHKVTIFLAVPTIFILLLLAKTDNLDFGSIRIFGYAGSAMGVSTIKRLHERFPKVRLHNFYGLTETTSIATILPAEDALNKPESVGKAVSGVELKVCDEEGKDPGRDRLGELWIRGANVCKGYFKREDANKKTFSAGWLHSGDFAKIDREGYVFLFGRGNELIIVGGENVYPVEVENVLSSHPGILEAAVKGEKDRIMGEVVKAFVVKDPKVNLSEPAIIEYCKTKLAEFKVPRGVEFIKNLPRNTGGKIERWKLA